MEEEKKKVKQIIDGGGKVIDTIIYEKDKNTITRKIEPVNGEPTSSTTIQTKDSINFQIKKGVEKECLVNRKKRKSY